MCYNNIMCTRNPGKVKLSCRRRPFFQNRLSDVHAQIERTLEDLGARFNKVVETDDEDALKKLRLYHDNKATAKQLSTKQHRRHEADKTEEERP